MSFTANIKEFFGYGFNEMDDDYLYDEDRYPTSERGYNAAPRPERAERPARTREAASSRDYDSSRARTVALITVSPRSYDEARQVGEPFRDGDAVILDLTDLNTADAKRLVDFAAGLCFALRGKMYNLSRGLDTNRRVFAITPEDADISTYELERAAHLR